MFALKIVTSLLLIVPALSQPIPVGPDEDPMEMAASNSSPMLYSNNFDMFVPYTDHQAAGSMHFQNFEKFVDSRMPGNKEMDMNESRFLSSVPMQAPKPLSAEERRIRSTVHYGDPAVERRVQRNHQKGTAVPMETANKWEQFDYDAYLG